MQLFIYEYTCALPDPSLPSSLRTEGLAMLSAVAHDFEQVPGTVVHTLPAGDEQEETRFRRLARSADFTLVIAPEFDGILEERCHWVVQEGGRFLGPSPEAVALTADKLTLAAYLRQAGLPTPPIEVRFPAVCKPRHGAGSQATFLVRSPAELAACLAEGRREMPAAEMLVQPLVVGQPASMAMLLGAQTQQTLLPAAQHLSADGRFRYLGGTVPLPAKLWGRAQDLARRAVAAVPGLQGYVGVDLVLGDAADGSADHVIEINPRLTTSYVGLRRLARVNLAEAMLKAVQGEPLAAIPWGAGTVHFTPDGTVTLTES